MPLANPCVEPIVRNSESFGSSRLDLDADGDSDVVVVYGDSDVNLVIALDPETDDCQVVFDGYITFRNLSTGPQSVTMRNIELVELDGDIPPEVHIALAKTGGGPREEVALHVLLRSGDGAWQETLKVTQCLAFSTFEIRLDQGGDSVINFDEDRLCQPPWSSERAYSRLKWDGSGFVVIETGEVRRWSTSLPWWNLVWAIPVGGAVSALGAVALLFAVRWIRGGR
jgi:hypothetical protein